MIQNILIIDQSKRTIELLNQIITSCTNYKTIIETNKDKILNLFTNTTFEYIIIDHFIEYSDEIITYILNKNPKQNVILLSDNIKCPLSCDDCSNLYKFVRLLKPVNPATILNYLNNSTNFVCPNKDRFNSIDTINKLYEFINLEDNILYKEKELTDNKMIIKSSSQNINIREINKIEKLINDSFFEMKLNENNEIEIFVK